MDVESARRDWEEGWRRTTEDVDDGHEAERLRRQIEVVGEELRRRVGSTFTLAELAQEYGRAEHWTREAVAEHAATPGWPRRLADVQDAAFHLYARGAVDYRP